MGNPKSTPHRVEKWLFWPFSHPLTAVYFTAEQSISRKACCFAYFVL